MNRSEFINNEIKYLRGLISTEMKAIEKILDDENIDLFDCSPTNGKAKAELQRRMMQIRQDTIKLEKLMYPKY